MQINNGGHSCYLYKAFILSHLELYNRDKRIISQYDELEWNRYTTDMDKLLSDPGAMAKPGEDGYRVFYNDKEYCVNIKGFLNFITITAHRLRNFIL